MPNPQYVLLSTTAPPSLGAGIIYPVWQVLNPTLHRWGLITSAAVNNAFLRSILEKLGLVRDTLVPSTDWVVYHWPFVSDFDGSALFSDFPDLSSDPPYISNLDAWLLPLGTTVAAPFPHAAASAPTEFDLLTFRPSAPSHIGLGAVGAAPNVSFIWHFGLEVPLLAGDEDVRLPPELFLFRYVDGWGGALKFHDVPLIAGAGDRLEDEVHRRSILNVGGGQFRLECRFDAPLRLSYFGAGLCRLVINPSSINLGFREDATLPVGIYLHDPDQREWLNVRVEMPPITEVIEGELPSITIPTVRADQAPMRGTPVPPPLIFELKLALTGWRTAPLSTGEFTGPPLLDYTRDARGGGFQFNSVVFSLPHPNSFVDLEAVASQVAGSELDLSDLVGAGSGISLALSGVPIRRIALQRAGTQNRIRIPIALRLDADSLGRISVVLCLELDPVSLRAVVPDRKIAFFLTSIGTSDEVQLLDLKAFALGVPTREIDFNDLNTDNADGYLNCLTKQFVLLKRTRGDIPPPPWIAFPGNLPPADDNNNTPDSTFASRLQLNLDSVDFGEYAPDHPLARTDPNRVLLAVGKEGVTFHGVLRTQQSVELLPPESSLRSVELRALPQLPNEPGSKSEIVMIDSQVVKAKIAFEMDLPGFENSSISGTFELRQSRRGRAPAVVASFDIRPNDPPIVGILGSKFLQAELTSIKPTLGWDGDDWEVSVKACGAFTVAKSVDSSAAGTFKEEAKLSFSALELTTLHAGVVTVQIKRSNPAADFSLLGGKLRCRLGELGISWKLGADRELTLDCRDVSFDVGVEGTLKFGFDTGRLLLKIDDRMRMSAEFPETIRIRVSVGSSFSFTGEALYNPPAPQIPYGEIGAVGEVTIGGIDAAVILKTSVVKKRGGSQQLAIVLGGGRPGINRQISAFVSVYSFLAGIAVNYRLRGISAHPNATEIVRNIDRLDPEDLDNWDLVLDDGGYVAIFGKAVLTSTITEPTVPNAYVTTLIASVDSQLRFLGAGRLWVASSINFAESNLDRPVLQGGIAFLPREKELSLHLETRRNPAIEANPQLALMLRGAQGTLDFVATRTLADYQVKVNFHEAFFGVQMNFDGGIRVAIFSGAVLAKMWFSISASYENTFEKGAVGIKFNAKVSASADYRMLLQGTGITGYAHVDFSVTADLEVWMEIEEFVWVEKQVKKLLKWVTQREQEIQMSRISGSISANVNFNGTAGMRSDGASGFFGTVSAGGSLRGHDFGLDVDFQVNPDVPKKALEKLSNYERRLDQAIADNFGFAPPIAPALAPPEFGRATAVFPEAAATGERWEIHSAPRLRNGESETHLLVAPLRYAKWYLGPMVDNEADVDETGIKLPLKDFITKFEFLESGTVIHQLIPFWQWTNHDTLLDEVAKRRAKGAEMAFLPTAEKPLVPPDQEVFVRDPRLESRARAYWREADRLSYPDFAAPARFAPLDELAANPNLAGMEEVVKYERLRLRARRAEWLRGEDLDETQQLERAKGGLVFGLHQELLGQVDLPQFETIKLPDIMTSSGPVTRELGLIARLREGVASRIDEVRVYRQDGDIEDYVSLPLTTTLARTAFGCRALPWGLDFVVSDTASQETGVTGAVVVQLPLFIPDKLLAAIGENAVTLGGIDIYRQVENEEPQRIAQSKIPGVLRWRSEEEGGKVTLYSFPEPIIHSDPFPVNGKSFVDGRIVAGRTPVLYRFEIYDNRGGLLETGQWSPVRLFIPGAPLLPSNLCVVVAAEQLAPEREFRGSPTDELLQLALCSLENGVATLLNLSNDEIEIYVDDRHALSSGFYTGDEFQAGREHPTPFLDDVCGDTRAESIAGKSRLRPESGTRGLFKIRRSDLPAGFRYRFFVRPATLNDDVLALPASVGLVQRRTELSRPEKVQAARHLEWPAKAIRLDYLSKVSFSADAVVFRHRNWVRVHWDAKEANAGGAELILVDRYDASLIVRQRVEVFGNGVFAESQHDFSSATGWTVEAALLGRLRDEPRPLPNPFSRTPEEYYVNSVVLNSRPLIMKLNYRDATRPAGALYTYLGLSSGQRHWQEIHRLTVLFLGAWTDFVRSPLFINDDKIRTVDLALPDFLTAMMVGIPTTSIAGGIETINAQSATIRGVLAEFQALYQRLRTEQFSQMTAVNDEPSVNALLDVISLAKPGVACLQRRWNTAQQMLIDRRVEPLEAVPSGSLDSLIRAEQFKKLNDNYHNAGYWNGPQPTTLVSDLLFKGVSAGSGKFEVSGDKSANRMQEFLQLLFTHVTSTPYHSALAKTVRRASGISEYLDQWQNSLDPRRVRLITRPHHLAGVERPADALAKLAETALENFRPDYVFGEDAYRFDPNTGKFAWHTDEQVAKGVAFWFNFCELMGFSSDVAANDATGDALSQAALLATLPEEIPDQHQLITGAGVAPQAFLPEQPRVGYGFIHVAVVPSVFLEPLIAITKQTSIPGTEAADVNYGAIKPWLELRQITLPADWQEARRIVYALAEIACLVLRAPGKDGDPRAETPCVYLDRRTTSPQPIPLLDGATALVPIPDHWGHEIDVLVAPLSRYEPVEEWLDRDRTVAIPWKAFKQFAHTVRFLPTLPPADATPRDETSAMVPFVFGYPHRTRIQFIYRTSDYGRRSLVNRIAEVRTGFRGTDLRFTFAPIDRPNEVRWELVLNGIEPLTSGSIAVGRTWKIALGEGPRQLPAALAGERLVALEHLPACFSYQMIVSDSFEGPLGNAPPTSEADVELTRRTAFLAFYQPRLEMVVGASTREFTFTLFLTKHSDNFTDLESANTPPDLDSARLEAARPSATTLTSLSVVRLPDLSMGYRIFYQYPAGTDGASGPRAETYILAAVVTLPWHSSYQLSSGGSPPKAMVQSFNGLFPLVGADSQSRVYVPICYQGSRTDPTSFVVQFKAEVDNSGQYFIEPTRFRLQPIRSDAEAEALTDFSI